jgi:hypothetical protein
MDHCTHKSCGKEHRIWLPSTPDSYGSIERHPFCTSCGLVQNLSDDRPKALGFWMNKLARLAYDLDLSQCQKRLIAKNLESDSYFNDTFGAYGSGQKELFITIVNKYCDTSRIDFDVFLPMNIDSK